MNEDADTAVVALAEYEAAGGTSLEQMKLELHPDYLEAESERYSTRVMKILPLTSGRIAVLGPRNELFRIVDTWDEAKGLGPEIYGVFTPQRYVELGKSVVKTDDIEL